MPEVPPKDWKLKLRYGQLQTSYQHFTVIADGSFADAADDYGCPAGPAVMTMRAWATDSSQAIRMAEVFGEDIGFRVGERVEVYDTPPEEPPRENPLGYDISFVPYQPES